MSRLHTRLPVLTYHAIADNRSPVAVRPGEFRRHVEALVRGGWRTLTLEALLRGHRDGGWPQRSCVLTFDDGYRSVLEHAAPLLSAHGLSAIVFVVADCVGGVNRWDAAGGALREKDLLDWDGLAALVRAGFSLGAHLRVGFAVQGASLGVADDHRGRAGVGNHLCGDIAGISAVVARVAILRPDADLLGLAVDRVNQRVRGRQSHFDFHRTLRAAIDRARFREQRARAVHFPIANDIGPSGHCRIL